MTGAEPRPGNGPPLVVLAFGVLTAFLGLPICETTDAENFDTPRERAAYRDEVGPIAAVVLAAAWVNRHGYDDAAHALRWLERPFAVRQAWNLYPNRSETCRTVEIEVDGILAHRTNDPAHRWLAVELHDRHLSYTLEGAGVRGRHRADARALGAFVARRARRDFPWAHVVTLFQLEGAYPCDAMERVASITARQPEWNVYVRDLE